MRAITVEIAQLGVRGHRPGEIAERLGIPVQRVYRAFLIARRNGIKVPKYDTNGLRHTQSRLMIAPELRGALAPHATARGLNTGELARRILHRVAEDGLIDAVLDDGGADAG